MSDILNLDKIKKARKVFEEYRTDMQNDRDRTAAVTAFVFCYELSWKTMKRYLHLKGIDLSTPKDVFRQAARANLINDPEPWFDFQKKRNLAAHTYDDVELHAVVASLDKFSLELTKLIDRIESTEI